jgi:hypothetical protein
MEDRMEEERRIEGRRGRGRRDDDEDTSAVHWHTTPPTAYDHPHRSYSTPITRGNKIPPPKATVFCSTHTNNTHPLNFRHSTLATTLMLQSNHTTNFYWWIMGRNQATDINIYCKVLHRVLYHKRTEMDSKKKRV